MKKKDAGKFFCIFFTRLRSLNLEGTKVFVGWGADGLF